MPVVLTALCAVTLNDVERKPAPQDRGKKKIRVKIAGMNSLHAFSSMLAVDNKD